MIIYNSLQKYFFLKSFVPSTPPPEGLDHLARELYQIIFDFEK